MLGASWLVSPSPRNPTNRCYHASSNTKKNPSLDELSSLVRLRTQPATLLKLPRRLLGDFVISTELKGFSSRHANVHMFPSHEKMGRRWGGLMFPSCCCHPAISGPCQRWPAFETEVAFKERPYVLIRSNRLFLIYLSAYCLCRLSDVVALSSLHSLSYDASPTEATANTRHAFWIVRVPFCCKTLPTQSTTRPLLRKLQRRPRNMVLAE